MAVWAREKLMRLSKGYYNRSKNCFRITIRRVFKALQYKYADRRIKKREMKTLWIQSINAACRDVDINYSRFMYSLNRSNMNFDRKILANLAQYEPYSFKAVVDEALVQATPPNMKKPEMINYKEAIDKKMLYYGPFTGDNKPVKDMELKFLQIADKNTPDWFGYIKFFYFII
jgi:large subunit ribosomal protein L20